MGQKLLVQDPFIDLRRMCYFPKDDFETFAASPTGTWNTALTNSSAPLVSTTAQDGVLVLVNTGAANDACFIYTAVPWYLWASSTPHMAECLLQFTEASTNQANIWFGFTSLNTVAQLVNGNAGPATSFTGAGIYKTGGSTNWRTISSQSTAQNINTCGNFATAGQAGYQRLRVQCELVAGSAGLLEVTYFIDQGAGMQQCRNAGNPTQPIKDLITLNSPATMYLGIGIKNGSANAETVNLDYAASWKLRSNFVASA